MLTPQSAPAAGQAQDLMEWADVWYRLDEGRGKITLDRLEGRIRRTVNNAQAIPQAISILHKADYGQKGCVEYKDFRHFVSVGLCDFFLFLFFLLFGCLGE